MVGGNSSLVNIHTLNINGLDKKMGKLTDFIKQNKIDILLLQETHIFDKVALERHLSNHGQRAHLNKEKNLHNNYDGTAFVYNDQISANFKIDANVIQTNRLQKMILVNDEKETIVFYNLYLTTGNGSHVSKQRCYTLKLLKKDLQSLEKCSDVYVGGDFNFVTNKLDTSNPASLEKKTPEDIEIWEDIKRQFLLKDLFREKFKDDLVYTKLTASRVARRIDRIYGSHTAIDYQHIPIGFSDHYMSPRILINKRHQLKWGKGAWKLNSDLLDKNTINTVKDIWNSFKSLDGEDVEILHFWDQMKWRLKKFFIIKGIHRSKEIKETLMKKENEINQLANNLKPGQIDCSIRFKQLKREILEYEKMKYKKYRIHNHIEEIRNEQENPDAEFFSSGSKKKRKSQIHALIDRNGNLQREPKSVINIIHQFYQNLWGSHEESPDNEMDQYLYDINFESDPEDNTNSISPFFTAENLKQARKDQMKKGGTPGPDGLTYEYYEKNWETLEEDMVLTLNNAYIQKQLPSSMYLAFVKTSPKKGKLTDVTNLRPISLLNIDYKILARGIYNKIIHIISKKASKNQKAIFPGRNVMEILLNTDSAINYVKERRKFDAAILKIDLQKAFDNVQHSFMFKMLKKFHVPDHLIEWVKILYKSPSSHVLVNGAFTPIIWIKKGSVKDVR